MSVRMIVSNTWIKPHQAWSAPRRSRQRLRSTLRHRAVRSERTIANYQDLVQKLRDFSIEQLQKAVESDDVCSSIDFLSWLAEAPIEVETEYSSLGAKLMAIREGYSTTQSPYITHLLSLTGPVISSSEAEAVQGQIQQRKSEAIEKAEIQALELDMKTVKARSVTALIGRKPVSKSDTEIGQLSSMTDIPKRIVGYLLSLTSDEEIHRGVEEALTETVDNDKDQQMDVDYLSTSPVQLIAVVTQWQQQLRCNGFIEELQTPVNIRKLELIRSYSLIHLRKMS